MWTQPLFARIYELDRAQYKERLDYLVKAFDIGAFLATPVRKLSLGERGLETHARCCAGEAQKIRPAGFLRLLDEDHQAQLIEQGFDLADTQILDDAIFELIERGTGELRRTRKLRLGQAPREPRAPDFMAYLLQFHRSGASVL